MIACLRKVHVDKFPNNNNWVLFSAAIEAFLMSIGEESDNKLINAALDKINSWYVGDGWYSDGPHFALDYYNSYVIHPFLINILEVLVKNGTASKATYDIALKRMIRYAEEQERMISPEGTYSPIGRSITYRTAAFQSLALVCKYRRMYTPFPILN